MSIKDRLAKKTEDLVAPVKGQAQMVTNPMRTGPGQMLMVNSLMKESNERVALLEERLKQHQGAAPVLAIDPTKVVPSRWANRDETSFIGSSFAQLKADIAESGGNVQPIKVRPSTSSPDTFEIVFGHRRHRACAELKLPVLAMVEQLDDKELFKHMERENRSRADLSPWEQGMMYKLALNEKLFTSREQLAREIGVDPGNLSKALRLADLDPQLLRAFRSPLELQYRWAKPLADALLHERERVLEVLKQIHSNQSHNQSSKHIFDRLVGAVASEVNVEQIRVASKLVAEVHLDKQRVTVKFAADAIDQDGLNRLKEFIARELTGN